MRKIIFIFIVGIILSGCSVTKNRATGDNVKLLTGTVLENAEYQNITNNGFFIQKAEIEILTPGGREKLIGTIKFEKPDKYLISIKSRTGIEGARIYITKDTVLVNDRINKKLYSGTSGYLKLKYGVSQNLLPLLFGDIILDSKCKSISIKCKDDRARINCPFKGVYLNYIIDCKENKTNMVSFEDQGVNIKYDNYFILNTIVIPRNVNFNSSRYDTSIKFKIVKVEYPWSGNISFIPGKDYELIELR